MSRTGNPIKSGGEDTTLKSTTLQEPPRCWALPLIKQAPCRRGWDSLFGVFVLSFKPFLRCILKSASFRKHWRKKNKCDRKQKREFPNFSAKDWHTFVSQSFFKKNIASVQYLGRVFCGFLVGPDLSSLPCLSGQLLPLWYGVFSVRCKVCKLLFFFFFLHSFFSFCCSQDLQEWLLFLSLQS